MLESVYNNEYAFNKFDTPFASSKFADAIFRYTGKAPSEKTEENEDTDTPKLLKDRSKEDITDDNVLKFEDKIKKDKNKDELDEEIEIPKSSEDKESVDIFAKRKAQNEENDFEYGSDLSDLTRSFMSLAASAGSTNDKVTKSQLFSLLQNLYAKGGANAEEFKDEIAFVKNLIAKFDVLSNGKGYITSFSGVNDIQDYKTVTKEQVTSPIDLRI